MTRTIPFTLAAGALLAPAAALADVVEEEASAFVTRETRVVEATPREAWMALVSPAKWWNDDHTWSGDAANMTLTPQAGGCFCERIPEVETSDRVGLAGSVQHMVVVYAAPDEALRMRGALGPLQSEAVTGVLTIALDTVEAGTSITFEYVVSGYMRYETPTISKSVDGVMTQQLEGLAALLGPVDAPETPDAPDADEPAAAAPTVDEAFGDLSDDDGA
ncbi:SRPBCC family protein [Pelagerythrobacter sp.]|uniref:SRPBCC family protein n=1 Tax=Pelagerythrobacter sp. TaxID=2800702 RepID=UPI0035B4B5F3